MGDLERLLAETLRDAGEGYEPSDPVEARRRFLERARHRRWYGFVEVAAVGGVAVAALFFFTRPSTEENVNRPQVAVGAPEVVARVAVGGDPVSIDSTSGSEVWVTGGDRLVAIDPDTNETTGMIIDLPADEIAVGESTLWVAHDGQEGTVTEVDPVTGDIVDTRLDVAATEGVTWDIAVEGDTLWAVDGFSGNVHSSGGELSFKQPIEEAVFSDVAAGGGEVWVLDESQGRVLKMSPIPNSEESYEFTVPAGDDADLAAGLSYVWVSPGDGTLVRVDPATGDNEELSLGDSYMDLTVHEKSVWALVNVDEEHKQLFEVNPGTMEVIGEPLQIEGDATDIVAEAGSVWVADGGGEVLRIEPARDTNDAPPPAEDDQSNVEPSPQVPGEDILFVYSANGDIFAETAVGDVVQLTDAPEIEQHPSFAPDGNSIVFEREHADEGGDGGTDAPDVVRLDLNSGDEEIIGSGTWPALAPDGRLAVVGAVGRNDSLVAAIHVSGDPSDPTLVVVNTVGTDELPNASHLSWSPDGERLVYQASGEGTVIKEAEVEGAEMRGGFTLVPSQDSGFVDTSDYAPGSNLVSPHASADGVLVLRLCCRDLEGDAFEGMSAGRVRQDIEGVSYEDIGAAGGLPGIDPSFDTQFVPAGHLRLGNDDPIGHDWETGGKNSTWFVFDDDSLWLSHSNGVTQYISGEQSTAPAPGHEGETDFRGLAVHPSLLD